MNFQEALVRTLLKIGGALRLDGLARTYGTKYPILVFFPTLDEVEAVRNIFGSQTKQVLKRLQVEFTWIGGYMWVNGTDGHLMISSKYLKEGDKTDIYLDLIHELVHVKQFMDGKELFDNNYSYAERQTEIEAYCYAVEEAKRLGLSNERICSYLKTEWMSEEEFRKLTSAVNVKC
jgi:hypothetical protein